MGPSGISSSSSSVIASSCSLTLAIPEESAPSMRQEKTRFRMRCAGTSKGSIFLPAHQPSNSDQWAAAHCPRAWAAR